ncbi:MAG: hypothetical protein DRN14_06320 [Thermoplasmata archaeon]|nr:MAG: hypothetical protein DRN14_06320 [Thermoplasmata archaeon]
MQALLQYMIDEKIMTMRNFNALTFMLMVVLLVELWWTLLFIIWTHILCIALLGKRRRIF